MTAQAETPALQADPLRPEYPERDTGRKTTYTPATAELIAVRLADGETLSHICRTPGMPSRQTVQLWRMRMPAFDALYMRARMIGMESMSDDTLMIADDSAGDVNPDGTANHANVQRARLMVDTRKFLLAKLAPKVYGDRLEVEHSGTVDHSVTLSDRERMRRLALFMLEDRDAGAVIEGQAAPALPDTLPAEDVDDHARQGTVDRNDDL